jgi:hypothetical protein
MQNEKTGYGDNSVATLVKSADFDETVGLTGVYHVECYDKDGNLKWADTAPNLVTAVGKQLMLDTLLVTASGYTRVGPFLGLVNSGGTYSYADTMLSHAGWTEFVNYTVGGSAVRGTAAFASSTSNAVASPNNVTTCAATAISFTITGAGGVVGGCFLATGTGAVNTQSSTAGTLYSVGNFTGGNKTVAVTDVLNVTYSTTATA